MELNKYLYTKEVSVRILPCKHLHLALMLSTYIDVSTLMETGLCAGQSSNNQPQR